MSETPVIEFQNIGKTFFGAEVETHALKDIDLAIEKGSFVSLSGPSGCGKSTLLSLIGLLDVPTQGRYLLSGKETAKLDRGARARIRNQQIGFIFQNYNLIGDLTVAENIALPLTYRERLARSEIQDRVNEAMEKVNMFHRRKHFPAQLSGGQQQRAAVARAIAGHPSIVLADEPTGNLDSSNAESVLTLLEQIHQAGATICMVTHNPNYAARAQRTLELFDGRLVSDRSVHDRLTPKHPSGTRILDPRLFEG